LAQNASAIDAEGLVRLSDGTFWIGEENGPSILHVASDGRILLRIVPEGTGKDYAGAGYPVLERLPAILAKRQTNRGIESMAVSPDERFLYFMLQNPLANPDVAAYQQAKNTRILKFDRLALSVVGQYVYRLDDPQTFRKDPSNRQSDPRVSELTALGTDRLLVLERTEATTKLYEIALAGATDILGTTWDDPATRPTLEQTNELGGTGIVPVSKRLVFDSADHPEVPGKIEGVAVLPGGALFIINDDDFGITGERTVGLLVRGLDLRVGD
ncbi:MAG: esterase-like activity of phytase family protein, partial [Elioraea sp.]|nr:esterase-like activity of phytase family protein [Elioraea sp.]